MARRAGMRCALDGHEGLAGPLAAGVAIRTAVAAQRRRRRKKVGGRDGTPHTLSDSFGPRDTGSIERDRVAANGDLFGLREYYKFQADWPGGKVLADEFAVQQRLLGGVCRLVSGPRALARFVVDDAERALGLCQQIKSGQQVGHTVDDSAAQLFLNAEDAPLRLRDVTVSERCEYAVGQVGQAVARVRLGERDLLGRCFVPAGVELGEQRAEVGRRIAGQQFLEVELDGAVDGAAKDKACGR